MILKRPLFICDHAERLICPLPLKIDCYRRKISYDEHGYRDPFQWTFLLGTNWTDYKAWKKEGFYDIDDPESNFQIINRTSDEV